jgi:hypothetical protein
MQSALNMGKSCAHLTPVILKGGEPKPNRNPDRARRKYQTN